jgi:DNA-binding response OmpR family regulator
MTTRCLLVRDGLEGALPAISGALRAADVECEVVARHEVGRARPADAVLLSLDDPDPVAACWELHRQGHSTVVAVSDRPNTYECVRVLNAGADFYLDAWAPLPEVVARVRVALRRSARLAEREFDIPRGRLYAEQPHY